ncbi:ribonuclease H-like protein, partial [Exidia glandulosa HHB12029]
LHDLLHSQRTWEDAMSDLFGPVRRSDKNPITVYTDGSCFKSHRDGPRAGAGVFWGPDCKTNVSARVPGLSQTNNRAELYAILLAVCAADPARRLLVHSDSEYAIRSIAEWAPMRAELGWTCTNGDVLQDICTVIRRRGANTHFVWVKAHAKNSHNDAADALAKKG